MSKMKKIRVSLFTVTCFGYGVCCGGPTRLGSMISSSGPGMSILLLLLLPIVWACPVGLACAELSSALPCEAGPYRWTQRAMGEFAGFLTGWWTVLTNYVDSSIYVVLAVSYIGTFFQLDKLHAWLIAAGFILICSYINIRGIKSVMTVSVVACFACLLPFAIFVVYGLFHIKHNPLVPLVPPGMSISESIGLGLAIAMWQYAGFSYIPSIAEEIKGASKLLPKALIWVIVAMVATYVLPTVVGLAAIGQWDQWSSDGGGISFVQLGQLLGGPILGYAMLCGMVVGSLLLYNDTVASGARFPWVLAQDNLFPKFVGKLHKKYGTPHVSIGIYTVVNLIMATGSFDQVVVADIFLMMFFLVVSLIAFVVLRFREPDLPRPFKVKGGKIGAIIMVAPAIAIAIIALFTNGIEAAIGGLIAIASGPVAYVIFRKKWGGIAKDPFDPASLPDSLFVTAADEELDDLAEGEAAPAAATVPASL
jgi:amino acid transporter